MEYVDLGLGAWFGLMAVTSAINWGLFRRSQDRWGALAGTQLICAIMFVGRGLG
jgi:hypothetical protein